MMHQQSKKNIKFLSFRWVLFLFLGVTLLSACRLQEDLKKVVVKVPTQTIAIPTLNSRLTIDDLLAINEEGTDEYLEIDEDSFITIIYQMDLEMPAAAGLDEITIDDVSIEDAIQLGSLPPIPNLTLPGDTVSFREIVGDQNADLIKILQAGGTIDTTICIDTAGTLDTTVCLDTSVTFDTTICVDTSIEFPSTSGIFIDTTICGDTSITIDTTVCADTSIDFDTILCVDTSIVVPQQSIFPYPDTILGPEPAEEIAFDLQGFSQVTMESGVLTMVITNDFPFALTSVRFDMSNKNGISIGTFTFPSDILPNTVDSQQIDLAGQILTDTLEFQLVSLGTVGDSGAIDVDNAMMSIGVSARNMAIAGATGVLSTDTLAYDSVVTAIDLPDSTMEISRARLGAGTFDYTFVSKFATDITIDLSIPSLTDENGDAFLETILLDYQGDDSTVAQQNISLINYNLDLSDDIMVYYHAYLTNPDDAVTLATDDEFSFDVNLGGIAVNYAEGYFGQMDLPAMGDTMDLGLYNSAYQGSIRFAEPSIRVNFENSFGLPIDLDVDMLGRSLITGDSVPVIVNGQVGYPTTPGQTIASTIEINEDDGLDDFFALPPNELEISLQVVTNPDSNRNILNFITDSAAISVGIEAEIPFYGAIDNFIMMDTMAFTAAQDLEVSTNAVFHINTENDFPATLGLQIYFTDGNYNVLDSLFSDNSTLLEAGQVDENGVTVQASENYAAIPFDEYKLANMRDAEHMIIKGIMQTSNNGQTNVRFYSYQGFSIQMGIQVDVSLDLIESLTGGL